ncbi:hypothetical protein MC7420_285 [Coleofasciculus chthonoplastes PCC 7420]|uniref:Uncharacterized protein n=1 Tax=Coleofasciculus chthonoplastes PCC 7420 TaxID=118168 RepID=B4VLB2_9CYAN|nr:hypothetical protein [Coleofasciculus chthonoplastes]EDX77148.1 hypothetical protein MC7420_285 [Coleofasciculus chthonoplastes PCC 7420]
MTQAQSRTYVTTTTNRGAVAFLNDAATVGYDAKIDALKLLLEQTPPSKSKLNTKLQQNHDINKRQANSIIAYVEGAVKSAKVCRRNHLEQLQGKLKHTTEVQPEFRKENQSTLRLPTSRRTGEPREKEESSQVPQA